MGSSLGFYVAITLEAVLDKNVPSEEEVQDVM